MRGVIVAACIAVVMIFGSVAYTNHIEKTSDELGEMNDKIMIYLTNDDYNGARDELGNLIEYLEKNMTMLAAIGDHEDFDKIEMNISEMAGYIYGEMQTDAISRCKVLDFMFEHLPKNYQLKLENIL